MNQSPADIIRKQAEIYREQSETIDLQRREMDALQATLRKAEQRVGELTAALVTWHATYNDCFHSHDEYGCDCSGCIAEGKLLELAFELDRAGAAAANEPLSSGSSASVAPGPVART